MIETELAFEVFVDPFGAPTLLDQANQVLLRDGLREAREIVVRRFLRTVLPFGDKPNVFTFRWVRLVNGRRRNNSLHRKSSGELLFGSFLPRHTADRFSRDARGELIQRDRAAPAHAEPNQPPDLQVVADTD